MPSADKAFLVDSTKLERGEVWGETDEAVHWKGAFSNQPPRLRGASRNQHEKPKGSHSYRGSASHHATSSNGVGFIWIAFLMPNGRARPRFGLD